MSETSERPTAVTPEAVRAGYALSERIAAGEPLRILSIDGGGYLGLATAAFIAGIESHTGSAFAEGFDLFCGTSTGAIISLALAHGKSGGEIVDLYESLGRRVFRRKSLGCLAAKYGNARLREELTAQFEETTLGDVLARGKAALVTAFNLTTGTPRIFKTDHSENLSRDSQLRLVDVAMASTAAPVFFPAIRVEDPRDGVPESFCDGGIVANHPALLGFTEALSELKAKPGQIRILSIATPRMDLGEGAASRKGLDRGVLAWRKPLPKVFIDSGSMVAHQILRRIVDSYSQRPDYARVEMRNTERLEMDTVTPKSTKVLKHCGRTAASCNEMRARVSAIMN